MLILKFSISKYTPEKCKRIGGILFWDQKIKKNCVDENEYPEYMNPIGSLYFQSTSKGVKFT